LKKFRKVIAAKAQRAKSKELDAAHRDEFRLVCALLLALRPMLIKFQSPFAIALRTRGRVVRGFLR